MKAHPAFDQRSDADLVVLRLPSPVSVIAICEACEAQQLRYEHGRKELELAEARAVLRQAEGAAAEVVEPKRQRLKQRGRG